MTTIWKYELQVLDMQEVEMPEGAEILCVQEQYDIPCLWAMVDPSKPKVKRVIVTHGTGHQVPQPENKKYISTYQITDNGALFVFHVFELIEKKG